MTDSKMVSIAKLLYKSRYLATEVSDALSKLEDEGCDEDTIVCALKDVKSIIIALNEAAWLNFPDDEPWRI